MTEISTDVFQMKKLFSLHIWTDVEGIKTQLTWAREIKKKNQMATATKSFREKSCCSRAKYLNLISCVCVCVLTGLSLKRWNDQMKKKIPKTVSWAINSCKNQKPAFLPVQSFLWNTDETNWNFVCFSWAGWTPTVGNWLLTRLPSMLG